MAKLPADLLESMEFELEFAWMMFEGGKDPDRKPDHGRTGVILALKAAQKLIKDLKTEDPLRLAQPLNVLQLDLEALNLGKQSALLTPRKPVGRPKEGKQHEYVRANASGAVSLLMKIGLSKDEAQRQVADELQRAGYGFLGRYGQITSRTVAAWRARAMEGRRNEDPISLGYQDFMSVLGNETFAPKVILKLVMAQIKREMPPNTVIPPT